MYSVTVKVARRFKLGGIVDRQIVGDSATCVYQYQFEGAGPQVFPQSHVVSSNPVAGVTCGTPGSSSLYITPMDPETMSVLYNAQAGI